MNNTTIINIFNSDNSDIAYVKTQNSQIMASIAYRTMKYESMIWKRMVENHEFFASVPFRGINSFAYINSITMQHE